MINRDHRFNRLILTPSSNSRNDNRSRVKHTTWTGVKDGRRDIETIIGACARPRGSSTGREGEEKKKKKETVLPRAGAIFLFFFSSGNFEKPRYKPVAVLAIYITRSYYAGTRRRFLTAAADKRATFLLSLTAAVYFPGNIYMYL